MNNFIDIYIDERDKPAPAFCGVCSQVLQTLEDTVCMHQNGGCRDCFISFLEPNRNLRGDDWVPSKKEIEDWLSRKDNNFTPMYRFF
tara:strand:+ start:924 stop:1184 length:261 start_codon:yes stop_codon:yes gene_type:complete